MHLDRSQKGPPTGGMPTMPEVCMQVCIPFVCKYAGKTATMTGMPSMHTVPNPASKILAQPPPTTQQPSHSPTRCQTLCTNTLCFKGPWKGGGCTPKGSCVCFSFWVPPKAFSTPSKASSNKSQPLENHETPGTLCRDGFSRAGFPGWGVSSHFA